MMIKKTFILLLFLLCFSSCLDRFSNENDQENKEQTTIALKEDKVNESDKDKNGCITGAGYAWSQTKKECLKLVEMTIPLAPSSDKETTDESKLVFLVFNESRDTAELFLPNTPQSILLPKKGNSWENASIHLTQKEGFTLTISNQETYVGENEIGIKVTGKLEEE